MLGSPFPPAVYIGHPGWKAVGGRIGYSLATGVAIALVCFLGLTALLLAVIPLVAILPILLYIGLVIGAQAFQASPVEARAGGGAGAHPEHRRMGEDAGRRRACRGGNVRRAGRLDKLGRTGVLYAGLESVGGGSVLAGMVLGAMAVFIIDNRLHHAAAWAFAGAILAYVGLIHGAQLGWAVSPMVALGYALFGANLLRARARATGRSVDRVNRGASRRALRPRFRRTRRSAARRGRGVRRRGPPERASNPRPSRRFRPAP